MKPKPPYRKFILFSYDDYYPSGGVSDIHSTYDTLDEAKTFIVKEEAKHSWNRHNNYDVVDRDTWDIVFEYNYD